MVEAVWRIDPTDPRAPNHRMSAAERERVVASLPADMPLDLHPPEGDPHRKPMVAELVEARDAALRQAEEESRRAESLATENEALRAELERLRRSR